MDLNDHGESDDTNGDGEGVWSPDIEQCFREALLLFPPCGRRKHILQEEGGGKMYGRNELIARHIMMRTGKSRTRKQVSSHIQVLARRKAKAEASSSGSTAGASPPPSGPRSVQTHHQTQIQLQSTISGRPGDEQRQNQQSESYFDVWVDRPIVTQRIRLVEFSAFMEYRNFQQNSSDSLRSNPIQTTPTLSSSVSSLTASGFGAEPDLSLQQSAHQLQAAYPGSPQHQPAHPLASNHHLSAQFNQASYQTTNQLQPHQHNLNQHQKSHQPQGQAHCTETNSHHLQPPHQSSAGFTRHSYIQIDYRQPLGRQANKLERIDISVIQDKFPDIGGSDGLFQRGPSDAFFLVKFWADLSNDYEYNIDDQNSYFGFSCHFETVDPYKDVTCSTKACSYGLQVVEKVEKIYRSMNTSNGRYSYDINRSPMCEFMIEFIRKLRQLPEPSQMNSVLENFSVLQVITSESTSEILLCLAYVFEVASSDRHDRPMHHVYKLTKG